MKSVLFIAFFAFEFVPIIIGSYPFFGRCPHLAVVKNFNITQYSGVWYEMETYFSIANMTASCTTINYSGTVLKGNEEGMKFVKKSYYKMSETTSSENGKIALAPTINGTTRTNGRLVTAMKSTTNKAVYEPEESYWILDTDYGNYSVVWSCVHSGIINFQNVKILTRTRTPSIRTQGLVYGVLKRRALATKILLDVDQTDCPNLFERKSSSKKVKTVKGKLINS